MDKSLTYHTSTLYYQVEGNHANPSGSQAPPATRRNAVVLLHGFAEDGAIWDAQIPQLKEQYLLIIPHLPGSGKSSLDNDTSMESLAEAVKIILDTEAIEKCILIGHSMGGYITLAFAEKYPGRLLAFGLFHSTAFTDTEEKKEARRKGIEFIRRNGSAAFIKQSTPNLFSETSRKDHPEWIDGFIEQYARFNPDALIRYYEAMINRSDRTHILRQFPGPILFIMGAQDSIIPLASGLQQCYMPSLSYIHILEKAGHMGMKEDIRRSNQFLQDFIHNHYYDPE